MVNLANINNLFTESDKIKHLVKYLEDADALLKKQEETISSLLATNESIIKRLDAQSAHLSSHDQHLKSHDEHLQLHNERLDMRT